MFTNKSVRKLTVVALFVALLLVTLVSTVYAKPSPLASQFDEDADVDGRDFLRPSVRHHLSRHLFKTADSDGDSDVDGADFLQRPSASHHLSRHPLRAGDFDRDGDVDGEDF